MRTFSFLVHPGLFPVTTKCGSYSEPAMVLITAIYENSGIPSKRFDIPLPSLIPTNFTVWQEM